MPCRPVALQYIATYCACDGDAERREVEAGDAAKAGRRDVPAHQVVREVGERMADRRQLPVEDREDARLGRMEDQVVEPVVAVDDRACAPSSAGMCCRQPVDQPVHRVDVLGLRRLVLLAPAADLAREIVARLAEVLEPDRAIVDRCGARRSRGSSRRRSHARSTASCPAGSGPTARGRRRSPSRRTRGRSRSRPRTAHASARPARRCPSSASITRYSRSIACADGSSFAAGPGFARIA